eukprot:scaffold219515_cov30-Tisochrysis_lutea.AAC.1
MVSEEASSIVLVEGAREAPFVSFERAEVEYLNFEQVSRLRRLDRDGAAQVVHLGQVDMLDVIGGVIVLDLAPSPVDRLDAEGLALCDCDDGRNIWMPTIVLRLGGHWPRAAGPRLASVATRLCGYDGSGQPRPPPRPGERVEGGRGGGRAAR